MSDNPTDLWVFIKEPPGVQPVWSHRPATRADVLAALGVEPVSDGNLLDWGLDPDEVEVFWRWKADDECHWAVKP